LKEEGPRQPQKNGGHEDKISIVSVFPHFLQLPPADAFVFFKQYLWLVFYQHYRHNEATCCYDANNQQFVCYLAGISYIQSGESGTKGKTEKVAVEAQSDRV